jgi:NitT/TauT family transport system ATP-binding protein
LIARRIWKVSAAGCSRLRRDFKTLAQSQQTTFLIVTHSIDEAIFLASRILVFGAPARLMTEIAVPSQAWEDRAVSDRIKNEVRSLIVAGARPRLMATPEYSTRDKI